MAKSAADPLRAGYSRSLVPAERAVNAYEKLLERLAGTDRGPR